MNIENMIRYAQQFVGKVPYSMTGARDPEKGTADCSSFVYWSAVRGGGAKQWAYSWAPSTMTMPSWLYLNGFKLIADNKSWDMKRGDIVIWGDPKDSWGANGHTGICLNAQDWIEETGYIMNVGIYNHDWRWTMSKPYFQVFRYQPTTQPPKPPQKPLSHDEAVLRSPVIHQGNAFGKLEYLNMPKKDTLEIRAWLVPDTPTGATANNACVILMEHGTTKELTRVMVPLVKRPDVKRAYNYKGGEHLGYNVKVNVGWLKGKEVDIQVRRSKKNNGEEPVNDVRFNDIYFTIG